jgi:defect-in-organelle-trafficking protein DotC
VYRIEQQARFAYAPPTWRAYLLSSYDFDPNLVAAVAPQNDAERTLWREGVEEGFNIGSEQADDILKQNLAVLNRDFVGMVLYHRMLDSGMVTKPYVAANRTNVNKSTDGSMHIGEVFMRITANPEFVATEGKWKTGPRSMVQERLQRMLDPDQAKAMQQEAVNSGRVSEVGGR